jgi:uncharacterized protein
MKNLSLLIKPASGNCQMRCQYCFYKNVRESREVADYGRMSLETLEILVSHALAEAESTCTFSFQGGEPTLMGLDFFQKFIDLQQKYKSDRVIVHNTMQTNGLLLHDDWCEFLARNRFLVGLSLDGSKDIHDANRLDAAGRGTYNRVLQAAALLEKHHAAFNILCVVTSELARRARHVYRALVKSGFRYLQFIPCIDDFGVRPGTRSFSLKPERYAEFLVNLFDEWYLDFQQGRYISVRHFDNWIQMLKGRPPESCSLSGQCSCYGVVEADGSVFPCDFYVLDRWRLGSIQEQSFAELLQGGLAEQFVNDSRTVAAKCQACRFVSLCRGGCRRDREPLVRPADSPDGLPNIYCSAYEQFFACALERMLQIARTID